MTREAMTLALDALENHSAIKHPQQRYYRDRAIDALRAALDASEREWVGLPDMEVYDLADEHLYDGGKNFGILSFYQAIEAKLKEKNA